MIYQQLVSGNIPYVLENLNLCNIPLHFHVELEITYCLEGEFRIVQNGQSFNARKGDIVIVGSNVTHEYIVTNTPKILLLEIGPMFLKAGFQSISEISFRNPVFSPGSSAFYDELTSYLNELLEAQKEKTVDADFTICGDIYKICASIVRNNEHCSSVQRKKSMVEMERALELIYYHYSEDISIEKAAAITGYGKSVFCKNFKRFTGMSFHSFLNNYRISTACYLLLETDMTVDAVANAVGFKDAKSFSRVFKSITNAPPSKYRKAK